MKKSIQYLENRCRNVVKIINLGKMDYQSSFDLQNRLSKKIIEDRTQIPEIINNYLILVEHFPVYTIGIRDSLYTKSEQDYLISLGAEFFQTDRGGLITFHGPGQLVAYPILNLNSLNIGVRQYTTMLEEVILKTCKMFDVNGQRSKYTGVWIENKKIAAIGIRVKRHVTSHGLALNCNTDLTWFDKIIPCGIRGKTVTSLSNESKKNITIEMVTPKFINAFKTIFSMT